MVFELTMQCFSQLCAAGADLNAVLRPPSAADATGDATPSAASNYSANCQGTVIEAGTSAMFLAIRLNRLDALHALLRNGADASARMRDGTTAVLIFAQKGDMLMNGAAAL